MAGWFWRRRSTAFDHQTPTLGGLFEQALQPELVHALAVHDQLGRHDRGRQARVLAPQRRHDRRLLVDVLLEAAQLAAESGGVGEKGELN